MKSLFSFLLLFLVHFSFAQKTSYWQQEVNYRIDVSLDTKRNILHGSEEIHYSNHSPDTLTYIWFHLWPNAYRNDQTAYAKQTGSTYVSNNIGYIDSLRFTVGIDTLTTEPHPEHIDIVKLLLNKPLLPGEKMIIKTPFRVFIPEYKSRLGYAGNDFYITQWYPKPAVYDRKGWHPMPYLDRGEFYSEFGSFDVSITLPSTYVVAATGELATESELELYKIIGTKNRNKAGIKYQPVTDSSHKTVRFVQNNIHDFAWFASENFIIRYNQTLLSNQRIVDVFTFSKPKRFSFWDKANDEIARTLFFMKDVVGEYPYGTISAVEGNGNRFSAGMEYPMISLLNQSVDYVLTHEIIHNWFYGVVGTNERNHAWMDEGFTDWYSHLFEKSSPVDWEDFYDPIDQPAERFGSTEAYFAAVYGKANKWIRLLRNETGADKFNEGMKKYFQLWKFKHPYPEDFQQVMEQVSGKKLNKIFALLKQPRKL